MAGFCCWAVEADMVGSVMEESQINTSRANQGRGVVGSSYAIAAEGTRRGAGG